MDYKQHKGSLRGQIKNQVERKLYNKRIRAEAIDVDMNERKLTIPDVNDLVCSGCGMEFSFLIDGLCFVCYSNSDEQTNC